MSLKSTRYVALRLMLVMALTLIVALVPVGAAFAATGDADVETTSTEAAADATATEAAVTTEPPAAPAPADVTETEPAAEKVPAAAPVEKPAATDTEAAPAPKQVDDTSGDSASGKSANESGPYDSTSDGSPSGNGKSDNDNSNKPCAGCVGNADDKNPPGQLPGPDTDGNSGYECDTNEGVGKTNPAHSGCKAPEPTAPAIHLEKGGPATSTVGGTVTYTFAVTNEGDEALENITVTDPMIGAVTLNRTELPAKSTVQVVAEGTKDYTIKATDVSNGKVTNTATATGTGVDSDKEVSDDDDHVLTVPPVEERKITICHAEGQPTEWHKITIDTHAVVTAGHLGGHHHDARDVIPPFLNPFTNEMHPGQGWDAAGQAFFANDCKAPAETPKNSIQLEKGGPTNPVTVGDKVVYTFAVKNTGEQTLTNVHVTDEMLTDGTITVTPDTLAPGETAHGTFEYTIQAGDIGDNGVHNTAWAHGTTPANTEVKDDDDHLIPTAEHEICHATGQDDKYVKISPSPSGIYNGHLGKHHHDARDIIPPFQYDANNDGVAETHSQRWPEGKEFFDAGCVGPEPQPAIELTKTGPASSTIGATITYDFVVKNNGDETLTDVAITDPLIGTEEIAVTDELAPGETATADAQYTILAKDVVDENVHNLATVEGTGAETGETVIDTDPHDVTVPLIVIGPSPNIELIKDGPATARQGDRITYTFTVRNTGETRLINVHVEDPMLGAGDIAITPSTLEPGESGTGSATYTITAADAKAGRVHNTAVATGTPPSGGDVKDEDDHTVRVPRIPEQPAPGIRLDKSGPATARVGDTITYRFRATNTGETTLTNVTITDAKLGLTNLAVTPSTLEPGESGTASATYTVLQADLERGFILNTALVTGTPPTGPPVTDRDNHRTNVPRVPLCCGPVPPENPPDQDLPATGMDSATTLLLAAMTLLAGFALLRATRHTTPTTPDTWSITSTGTGGDTPPPVHRRRTSTGSGGFRPRTG